VLCVFCTSHVVNLVTGSVLQVAKERVQIRVAYVDAPTHGRSFKGHYSYGCGRHVHWDVPVRLSVCRSNGAARTGDQLLKPVGMRTAGVHLVLYLRRGVRDIGDTKQRETQQTVYGNRDVDITPVYGSLRPILLSRTL